MDERSLAVCLTERMAADLQAATGLPLEAALAAAFRRGLELLSGRHESGATDALELEAAEALNTWRVLHRLRENTELEASVERLESENARLRTRLRPLPGAELYDQEAAIKRLFGPPGGRR